MQFNCLVTTAFHGAGDLFLHILCKDLIVSIVLLILLT